MNTDYELSPQQAEWLKAVILLPREMRVEALNKFSGNFGSLGVLLAFADFIGLANSVIAHGASFLPNMVRASGVEWPEGKGLNLPTIFGALEGIGIANHAKEMCHDCAFRQGTAPNQTTNTIYDTEYCATFLCHIKPDQPACAGWIQHKLNQPVVKPKANKKKATKR